VRYWRLFRHKRLFDCRNHAWQGKGKPMIPETQETQESTLESVEEREANDCFSPKARAKAKQEIREQWEQWKRTRKPIAIRCIGKRVIVEYADR